MVSGDNDVDTANDFVTGQCKPQQFSSNDEETRGSRVYTCIYVYMLVHINAKSIRIYR